MNSMTRVTLRTGLMPLAAACVLVTASGIALAAEVLDRVDGKSDFIGVAGGPATLTYRKLNTPAGETTGAWHYHPGYVYNVVEQGTVTIEDGCGDLVSFSAGEAFETSEGRVHRAYNLGEEDAIEQNMFISPPGRPITVLIPGNQQLCGPPSTVSECHNGGWAKFDHPQTFANQGACIAYVKHRPETTPLVPADPLP